MASAGPNSPATEAQDTTLGTIAWGSYTQAKTSNDVRDSVVLATNEVSYYIKVTGFGFALPAGATVTGVKVEVEGYRSAAGAGPQWGVKLVKGGTIQGNQITKFVSTTVDYVESFGADGEMWGLTLLDTDIEASTFGCVVQVSAGAQNGLTYYVDHIRITVYYVPVLYSELFAHVSQPYPNIPMARAY